MYTWNEKGRSKELSSQLWKLKKNLVKFYEINKFTLETISPHSGIQSSLLHLFFWTHRDQKRVQKLMNTVKLAVKFSTSIGWLKKVHKRKTPGFSFSLNSLKSYLPKSWFACTYVPPTLRRGDTYPYLVKLALNVTIVDQDLLFKKKAFLKMFMYTNHNGVYQGEFR